MIIDYRGAEDRKTIVELRGDFGVIIDTFCLPLFYNSGHHLPKNEPFSQKMHLKIFILNRGLKFSNSKPSSECESGFEIDT
jgi:hypothetical protein